MSDSGKAVINLTLGHEDADKVAVAFLVATTAGKSVTTFLTKGGVRVGLPGYADAIESAGAPPATGLFERHRDWPRRAVRYGLRERLAAGGADRAARPR